MTVEARYPAQPSTAPPWTLADSIEITDISLRGLHGALPDERMLGQRYSVDVILWTDLSSAGASDELADTVDYGNVSRIIVGVSRSGSYRLMEHLAQSMADAVLDAFPVLAVTIAVKKRPRGIPGVPREVTVRLTRQRKT